ncbi:MAG: hypothetical protein KJ905_04010, partial [Nanoarchaeota archaeon]|nr:hypothetical protein [Nanoarchaeota archaeon]MBU1501905.1 hypothetical protein [Nanoarchaeota archaeon]
MSSLTKKLGIGLLGVSLLTTGCDTSGNIELVRTEIKGRTTVTLTQEVRQLAGDRYILTVRDSTGKVIANMKTSQRVYYDGPTTVVVTGKGTYNLEDKGYRIEN